MNYRYEGRNAMTQDELMQVLQAGESSMVEFKRCSELPHTDTFETVCSFANRSGGSIYLGVDDDGQVLGVDSKRVSEIERNVVNVVSNRKMFEPAPMVETEHIEYDERIIVRIWVAPSSSVVRFKGAVFDRIADVDTHIESDIQISQMYIRKQNYYSERRIFRYVTPFDLRPELIARMRQLAVAQRAGHPWGTMSDEELFRSAKLYDRDYTTGEEGFNLAAVLLLGKDEVISSVCPAYITDAVVRRDNIDRYDDRLMMRTNLFDSYEQLREFTERNLPDRFVLKGDKRVSPRTMIARELVANSLMHREYSSPVVARVTIDNESIRTVNASRSFFEGRMKLGEFTPMPKNPIIANVFVQTGIAEQPGSGLRNLIRASRQYTEREPEFRDGDIFEATIPIVPALKTVDGSGFASVRSVVEKDAEEGARLIGGERVDGKKADATASGEIDSRAAMLSAMNRRLTEVDYVTVPELAKITELDNRTVRKFLNGLVAQGKLIAEGNTRGRRYRKG